MTLEQLKEIGNQFEGDITLVPFAQIINPNKDPKIFGIGIQDSEANSAHFKPDEDWLEIKDYYRVGSTIFVTSTPRILFLNSSDLLLEKEGVIKLFKKSTWAKDKKDAWKIFRYAVVYFLDRNQNLLSKEPFRIKLAGSSGYALFQSYYSSKDRQCFCKQLLSAFKLLSPGNKGVNEYFFTHGIFAPTLVSKTVELDNGDTVGLIAVKSFEIPDGSSRDSFLKTFINGKSETSNLIKSATEVTQSWVDSKRFCTDLT